MTNYQRPGATSNAHAGREFEADALAYFAQQEDMYLTPSFSLDLGVTNLRKPKAHRFDLGSNEPAVLVECKSHNWTASGNMPSAKITVWNEAMYYFHLAPDNFKKILFVLEARHDLQKKTLAEYYVDINGHLIPNDVAIIEFNTKSKSARIVKAATS